MAAAPVCLVVATISHGSLIFPASRNSADRALPEFAGGKYVGRYGCNCGDPSGCAAGMGSRSGSNGQGCGWFSQGCTIGCPVCDNQTQHTHGKATCPNPIEPLLNAPDERTVNRRAKAGSDQDAYRYNPWRAPGYAPVTDACGMAGGAPVPGAGHASFHSVPWAKQGDLGSKVLQKGPAAATWVAGSVVEVGWGLRFNHG